MNINDITIVSDHTGKHGADVSAIQYNTQSWWTTAANWDTTGGSTSWNFSTVWEWDGVRNLPKLRNVVGQ